MLKRQGQGVNHKRVARLMQELGLMGKLPVKRKRTTNSQHAFQRYPNRVMTVEIERPDQVWVGDITYIRLQQDFCLSGRFDGRLHPKHTRLAPGSQHGPKPDTHRLNSEV